MTISFPSNPSANDTYTYLSRTWLYTGEGWEIKQAPLTFNAVTNAIGYTPLSIEGGTINGELSVQGNTYTNKQFTSNGHANIANALILKANITSANILYANITSANIVYANIASANIVYANVYGGLYITDFPRNNAISLYTQATGYSALELKANTGSYIDFGPVASDFNGRIIYNNAANAFNIFTGSGLALTIDQQANTGIATGNPLAPLHVTANNEIVSYYDSYGVTGGMRYRKALGTPITPTAVTAGTELYFIGGRGHNGSGFAAYSSAVAAAYAEETHSATAGGAYLTFSTTTNGSVGAAIERMRITANGNIGIAGITAPAFNLDAGFGTIRSGNFVAAFNGYYLSYNIFWNGSAWQYVSTDYGGLWRAGSVGELVYYNAPSGAAGTVASMTPRIKIDASGNVGIGGTLASTSSKLYVDGGDIFVSGNIASVLSLSFVVDSNNAFTILTPGPLASRPATAANGAIRYNTDYSSLEVYSYTNGWSPAGGGSLDVNVVAVGGGGGGGGVDSTTAGQGATGAVVWGDLSLDRGATYTVYIGGGGGPGASAVAGTGGGTGGTNGGGTGGNAGAGGTSGAGGGGGGYSGIAKGGSYLIVAGGGGGGGGTTEGFAYQGPANGGGVQTRGQNGMSMSGTAGYNFSGDGGGGGGGGGGFYGGIGQGATSLNTIGAAGGGNLIPGYSTSNMWDSTNGAGASASNVLVPTVAGSWWTFANTYGRGGGQQVAGVGGIVAIRYPGSVQKMTGGTVTISGGYVVHEFTTNLATFTVY